MRVRRSVTERRRLLTEYRASGMSRRQFCEQHQLPLTTLDSWKRAERGQAKRPLVAVKIEDEPGTNETTGGFTLTLANGRRIASNWQFRDAGLARLIRVAESA